MCDFFIKHVLQSSLVTDLYCSHVALAKSCREHDFFNCCKLQATSDKKCLVCAASFKEELTYISNTLLS